VNTRTGRIAVTSLRIVNISVTTKLMTDSTSAMILTTILATVFLLKDPRSGKNCGADATYSSKNSSPYCRMTY
jgi:hypothetical protein